MAVTDFSSIRDDVFERYDAEVAFVEELPTQYPNADFDRPNAGPWAELQVIQTQEEQRSFGDPGNNRWDVEGTMGVRLFIPIGSGTSRQESIIDTIKTAFESKKQNGIVWLAASVQEVGRVQNDWLFVVNVPFQAHVFK